MNILSLKTSSQHALSCTLLPEYSLGLINAEYSPVVQVVHQLAYLGSYPSQNHMHLFYKKKKSLSRSGERQGSFSCRERGTDRTEKLGEKEKREEYGKSRASWAWASWGVYQAGEVLNSSLHQN